ncbi:MAG TPA: anthranilate synthase component I family protein [Gemmatimonadaceae bacterium]|nr:anthranilate synthase component I family protein [Gemmatimonadaceae bacterium]
MSLDGFKRLAATSGLVPVWRDCVLDTDTPVTAFAKLRRGPFAFLLESAPAGGETWARYTYMGSEPRFAWRLTGGVVDDWTPGRGWHNPRTPPDPLADLARLVEDVKPSNVAELGEFWSGIVGFFSYDVARVIERLPVRPKPSLGAPDALFVFTRSLVILDNLHGRARVVISVPIPPRATDGELESLHAEANGELEEIFRRLRGPVSLPPLPQDAPTLPREETSSYDRTAFIEHVERIREYIRAGDCFQVLLSRRIDVPLDFDPSELYRALRAINPSPYMYHLVLDGLEIVGSSPELLVRVSGSRVILRPIAGTRRRATEPEGDDRLAGELLADEKERAEHVMLVDLGRNDVGRVSTFGSVRVTEFMKVEKFSHVLHIVSQVEGNLRPGLSGLDVFRATFPAGTMTGAPKIRAMEIIDELEPVSRGPYAGAIGYIAAGGARMDLAITIRTCIVTGGKASVQAGAGIVADSVGETEWDETRGKAEALLSAIAAVRRPSPASGQ